MNGIERATYLSYPSRFEPLWGTPFHTQCFVICDCRHWHRLDWNGAENLNALEGSGADCALIISAGGLVRLSFRWFLALSWMLQKCGIVSRIIPYDFNRWGAGSHLYTANANTLRSGHRVMVLPTLAGHSLWDCLTLANSQESACYRYAALMVLLTLQVLRPLDVYIVPYWH